MSEEMIVLTAPEGVTDVSFGSAGYTVEDGRVEVPLAAAEHLYQFGFGNAPEPEQEPEKPKRTRSTKAEQ